MSTETKDIEILKQIIALQEQIIELYVDEYSNCSEDPNFLRIRDGIYEKIQKLEIILLNLNKNS